MYLLGVCRLTLTEQHTCYKVFVPFLVKLLLVVIFAVSGVLVIGMISGGTYYWVRKRRKCRKDPRSEFFFSFFYSFFFFMFLNIAHRIIKTM